MTKAKEALVEVPLESADTLAEAMYETYRRTLTPSVSVPLPSWAQLEGLQQNAWRAVAAATVEP